jgi:serine/threonine protein kinase
MSRLPQIPGYELLQCLGGGPLTIVYTAQELSTDQKCVVKVLRAECADDSTAIKLLQREARAGLTVRHPHLVRLLHAHVTRPPYFLVMELLLGESLRRRLRRDYRLPLPTTLWIARQTVEALGALHRAGFVHGDVKPDNIRLVDDGTAKLIDLGFAHRPGENAALLGDGYLLGTVNYLAPELCAFEPDYGYSTDVFSLGVTIFEMLTGRLPYPAGTTTKMLRRHRCDPPADIRRLVPSLPPVLVGLLERLLAHKPADRPRASAVVQQLVSLEIATLRGRKSA